MDLIGLDWVRSTIVSLFSVTDAPTGLSKTESCPTYLIIAQWVQFVAIEILRWGLGAGLVE